MPVMRPITTRQKTTAATAMTLRPARAPGFAFVRIFCAPMTCRVFVLRIKPATQSRLFGLQSLTPPASLSAGALTIHIDDMTGRSCRKGQSPFSNRAPVVEPFGSLINEGIDSCHFRRELQHGTGHINQQTLVTAYQPGRQRHRHATNVSPGMMYGFNGLPSTSMPNYRKALTRRFDSLNAWYPTFTVDIAQQDLIETIEHGCATLTAPFKSGNLGVNRGPQFATHAPPQVAQATQQPAR